MFHSLRHALWLPLAFVWPAVGQAQPTLTLGQALDRARAQAYAVRIAEGQAAAQTAQTLSTYRGVLPSVRVESGWMRTTDPIGAFGTTLRQRVATQADFDPTRLNDPSPIGNWSAALIVEQPLFNADAHLGRRSAARAASAAASSADWARAETELAVVQAYYGAVLAVETVATLEAAVKAADGHVRQAGEMVEAGFATKSDALLAQVKAGEVEAQLLAARGEARLARRQLALLLGAPEDTAYSLPARLPAAAGVNALLARPLEASPAERADVQAAQLQYAAVQADALRAKSQLVPRMNAFARLDWNSALRPYAGEESWTAGVMLTWTPFSGASELADIRGAAGRSRAAQAGVEAAEARARLAVESAEIRRGVALAQMAIAQRAAQQSAEAHRIVARKYDGGLATVVELLDAAAVETRSGLTYSAAVYEAIVAEAERRHASGMDLAALAALQPEPMRTER